jgi:NAD dependent epimerase/dehydratase family enzyme
MVMLFLLENEKEQGVYNLCVPNPARMADVGKALAKVLKRPYWMPVPAFGLKIVLGEMSKIVLEGQRAIPKRLIEAGYPYQFADLDQALREIFTP